MKQARTSLNTYMYLVAPLLPRVQAFESDYSSDEVESVVRALEIQGNVASAMVRTQMSWSTPPVSDLVSDAIYESVFYFTVNQLFQMLQTPSLSALSGFCELSEGMIKDLDGYRSFEFCLVQPNNTVGTNFTVTATPLGRAIFGGQQLALTRRADPTHVKYQTRLFTTSNLRRVVDCHLEEPCSADQLYI